MVTTYKLHPERILARISANPNMTVTFKRKRLPPDETNVRINAIQRQYGEPEKLVKFTVKSVAGADHLDIKD